MRVDKFLKVSGLIPRRTVAKEACDAGRVTIDGRPAKASDEAKAGQRLSIDLGRGRTEVMVREVPAGAVRREHQGDLYQRIEQGT
ncbi:MAG: RNA-binding S4 domain-containing protein [Fimbriimonadaceae bacterium]|nr:RNA-binding S4 domain-containing protein [Fimbriimonadaceae bacterium]